MPALPARTHVADTAPSSARDGTRTEWQRIGIVLGAIGLALGALGLSAFSSASETRSEATEIQADIDLLDTELASVRDDTLLSGLRVADIETQVVLILDVGRESIVTRQAVEEAFDVAVEAVDNRDGEAALGIVEKDAVPAVADEDLTLDVLREAGLRLAELVDG